MYENRTSRPFTAILLSILCFSAAAHADYAIDWWTVDGGGAMFSTGGAYSLGGTIGQPDAGVMSGGSYTLVGGFWAVSIPSAPEVCLGDADCDGDVDFFDIDPFVAKLGCPGVDPVGCSSGCSWQNCDVDEDGDVDFFDIDPFVGQLGSVCP
jgi:hypothetical protein